MEGDQEELRGPSSLYRRVRWRLKQRRWQLALASGILLIGAVVYLFPRGSDLHAQSTRLSEGPVKVATRTPRSYRIVYRVENRGGAELTVSTERLFVRRPFEAREETFTGPPPGKRRLGTTVHAFARLQVDRNVLAVPPASASADRRPDAFIKEALQDGYASQRERRRVAGRVCRVFRVYGESDSVGVLPVSAESNHIDVCIDEAGLVLEENRFVQGKTLTRRIAVAVTENPVERIEKPEDPEFGRTRGIVRELDPKSRLPGGFFELARGPKGFEHRGRYTVVPPQGGAGSPGAGQITAFMSDVWTNGSDVFVIEQGGTQGRAERARRDPSARRVEIAGLGGGDLRYGLRNNEFRVLTMVEGFTRFVRIAGTLPPSKILDLARNLEKRRGGPLVPLRSRTEHR